MTETATKPLVGEIRAMLVDGKPRQMIWNGEKWLRWAEVYPLMYFAQTGTVLDDGDELW